MTKTVTTPYRLGMQEAASMLNLRDDQIRLACGEVTAQELRTVRAILISLQRKMKDAAEEGNEHGF